jgi:hypothetical protein
MSMENPEFVCAGCGKAYPLTTPSKYVKRVPTTGLGRFLVFHSVDCLIAWDLRAALEAT